MGCANAPFRGAFYLLRSLTVTTSAPGLSSLKTFYGPSAAGSTVPRVYNLSNFPWPDSDLLPSTSQLWTVAILLSRPVQPFTSSFLPHPHTSRGLSSRTPSLKSSRPLLKTVRPAQLTSIQDRPYIASDLSFGISTSWRALKARLKSSPSVPRLFRAKNKLKVVAKVSTFVETAFLPLLLCHDLLFRYSFRYVSVKLRESLKL